MSSIIIRIIFTTVAPSRHPPLTTSSSNKTSTSSHEWKLSTTPRKKCQNVVNSNEDPHSIGGKQIRLNNIYHFRFWCLLVSISSMVSRLGYLTLLSTIFSYIMVVSLIGGGNRGTTDLSGFRDED